MKSHVINRVFADRIRPGLVCLSLLTVQFFCWNGRVAQANIIFTDRAAFEAGLPSGFYKDDFSSASIAVSSPELNYVGIGGTPTIGTTVTAPSGGLFIGQLLGELTAKFIGPWEDTDDLMVAFNTANVYRVGIDVAIEDFNGPVAGDVTFDFSSGATATLSLPASSNFSFLGIYSDTPLSWMKLRAVGGGVFTNTTRLTTAVPEPSSGLMAMGIVGAICWRRRQVEVA